MPRYISPVGKNTSAKTTAAPCKKKAKVAEKKWKRSGEDRTVEDNEGTRKGEENNEDAGDVCQVKLSRVYEE